MHLLLTVSVMKNLPDRFRIETPIGTHNPDWAAYLEKNGEQKLFFVLETKDSMGMFDLRTREQLKIHCGKRHFEALENVSLQVARDWSGFKKNI